MQNAPSGAQRPQERSQQYCAAGHVVGPHAELPPSWPASPPDPLLPVPPLLVLPPLLPVPLLLALLPPLPPLVLPPLLALPLVLPPLVLPPLLALPLLALPLPLPLLVLPPLLALPLLLPMLALLLPEEPPLPLPVPAASTIPLSTPVPDDCEVPHATAPSSAVNETSENTFAFRCPSIVENGTPIPESRANHLGRGRGVSFARADDDAPDARSVRRAPWGTRRRGRHLYEGANL
jgi:hypothetical protein